MASSRLIHVSWHLNGVPMTLTEIGIKAGWRAQEETPMEKGRPSATAMGAAMARAAHLLLDGERKILRDDLALGLSGMENEAALRALLQSLQAELPQHST